jgi:hypothetical protein
MGVYGKDLLKDLWRGSRRLRKKCLPRRNLTSAAKANGKEVRYRSGEPLRHPKALGEKHIPLNPVKRGLAATAEQYPYSSATAGMVLDAVHQRLKPYPG